VGRDESGALVMRLKRAITGIFIAIVALSLSGCAGTETKDSMHNHSTQAAGDLSSDDVMFLQMMIPHHQQAIDISDLALTKSADSELLALAKNIRDEQGAEIVKMKSWLEEANASSHSDSHSMDGMLSDAELAALDKATGKSFDVLWLKAMTGHHTGAIDMATMIENAKSAEIKSFGEGIVASQSAQNKAMAAMIKRIG
jgi:uncharacterized protein (DUF305 family)